MSGNTASPRNLEPAAPRFDRQFIEENDLIERYLNGKLPFKGARDLEQWCREHPEFLEELNLTERTHASLKLLEASGRPQDLREPPPKWWKTPYFQIGLGAVTFLSLVAFWVLFGKYVFLSGRLTDVRAQLTQGTMVPATSDRDLLVDPDRAPGINHTRIVVSRAVPELINLRIAMGYVRDPLFRVIVDKQDQGRALVISNLSKDSNGELKVSFNTSALAGGIYTIRIESLPFRGSPIADGWAILDVR